MENKFYILALGCKVNTYEIEAIKEELINLGYEQVEYSYGINDRYIYAELKISDKERNVIIDMDDKKVSKELENRYKLILEVEENE